MGTFTRPRGETHILRFEISGHALGGIQPEGAPAGQENRMGLFHQVVGKAGDQIAGPGG